MPEPEELLDHIIHEIAYPKNLTGKKILVTAGPTREALDPVRFLTNHSTGKMGYAIAGWRQPGGAGGDAGHRSDGDQKAGICEGSAD